MALDKGVMTYKFTWRTQGDEKVCPECLALEGKEWILWDFEDELHGLDKPVYSLAEDRALTHGGSGTCRCDLLMEVRINMFKLKGYDRMLDLIRRVDP